MHPCSLRARCSGDAWAILEALAPLLEHFAATTSSPAARPPPCALLLGACAAASLALAAVSLESLAGPRRAAVLAGRHPFPFDDMLRVTPKRVTAALAGVGLAC
jgi:hypothetical protein